MPPASAPLVLVVDDEPDSLRFMAGVLQRHGYSVTSAPGGRAALSALQTCGPHLSLVITDVMMPVIDGRSVALEAGRICPGVHVIYVSVLEKERLVLLGRVPSDAAFLAKPYTAAELVSFVRLLVGDAPSPRAQVG